MKSTAYSDKVLDHFRNPRNVGSLEGESVSKGRVGNPVCGDLMEVYIEVKDNIIQDIKVETFGCGSAIATASMVTEMAKGKTLEEAEKITRNDVATELDGLPPVKMHCSNLAADALKDAIKNHREGKHEQRVSQLEPGSPEKEIKGFQEYLGKGIYRKVNQLDGFRNLRIIIIDTGPHSFKTAIDLINVSPRVVWLTRQKEQDLLPEMKKQAKEKNVKLLYESALLEIEGYDEVEKVKIHNLDEDETYHLFTDAVIVENQL